MGQPEQVVMKVEGLRSPAVRTLDVVYFARMADKIRLQRDGRLPQEYVANLGHGFDARFCSLLRTDYARVKERVLAGGTDEEILESLFGTYYRPTEFEVEMFNEFLTKRGWCDDASDLLEERKAEAGLQGRKEITTFFQLIEADESR